MPVIAGEEMSRVSTNAPTFTPEPPSAYKHIDRMVRMV